MSKSLRSTFSLIIFAAVVLTACAPQPQGGTKAEPPVESFYGYDTANTATGGGAADVSIAAPEVDVRQALPATTENVAALDRLVIKNATLALVVQDPMQTAETITGLVEGLEGFVVSSNTYQASVDAAGNKIMQAYLTVRVPVGRLSEALSQLKGLAVTVNSENISGEDVTAQYTDLESQLTNLQAAETQLQTIMDGAKKTEEVLSVYNQLVLVRGQIEQIKGQMKYYRESAAMSLISIDLIPDALSQPLQVAGWQPEGVAKEAFEALVRAFQGLATSVIWGVIYLLPLGLLFGLPLYAVVRVALRRMQKSKPSVSA